MLLKCECCDYEKEFVDGKAAYDAGWDALPHFSTHITCSSCPIGFLFGESHDEAHAMWERVGRPSDERD